MLEPSLLLDEVLLLVLEDGDLVGRRRLPELLDALRLRLSVLSRKEKE